MSITWVNPTPKPRVKDWEGTKKNNGRTLELRKQFIGTNVLIKIEKRWRSNNNRDRLNIDHKDFGAYYGEVSLSMNGKLTVTPEILREMATVIEEALKEANI